MIGLDTNVLIRYTVRDDPSQTALADGVIDGLDASNPAFVPLIVVVECWWVLGRAYGYPTEQRQGFVDALLTSEELLVESPDALRAALRGTRDGADLADALIAHAATTAGCERTLTFDRGAARRAGMQLLTSP